ncbi:hypothetical protein CR513_42021, partial [Mucuna pruriens]
MFPQGASIAYKEKLESDAKYYIWDDRYLWRLYNDQIIRSRSSIFVIQHPKAAIMDREQLGKSYIVCSIGPL